MNTLRSTFFLTLCILFTSNVVFAKIPTEAAFIVGEWESTDSTNRYRMRVFWNDSNNEFYGVMTKNGRASARVGFKIDEHVFTAEVELAASLGESQVSLQDIMDFKEGDIIPFEMPEHIVIKAEGMPCFRASYGQSNGFIAIKVSEEISREHIMRAMLEE